MNIILFEYIRVIPQFFISEPGSELNNDFFIIIPSEALLPVQVVISVDLLPDLNFCGLIFLNRFSFCFVKLMPVQFKYWKTPGTND